MIIEKINIKSFGMITDMALDFSENVNVIIGSNESGKSTVAAFIKYMLYGFENDTPEGETDERARRVNWENGKAEGSMTVRTADKRYIINRITERVDNGQRVSYKEDSSIIDAETGAVAFGKVPAGEAIFGVDKDLFINTAFVGEIGDSSISEGAVKQSIENILFSGSEKINNQRAASKVAVMAENLMHKSGSGGAIYELVRRTEQLEERFKSADEDNKQILAKEAKLHELRENRRDQKALLDKFTELDECHRNVLIIQSFDNLHQLEKDLDAKADEYGAFVAENAVDGFVPSNAYLTDLAVSRRGVDDAYRALVEAQENYEEQKRAVGITKEMENAIEYSDSFGGEDSVEAKATLHTKNIIKNLVIGGAGVLLAIAAIVFEIAASGVMASLLPRIAFGVLGAVGLAAAGALGYFTLREKREIDEICKNFGTANVADLKAKIAVLREEREKRDRMLRDTESARIAVERSKENYAAAKQELLDNILKWGEEPPTSNLNEFLNSLEDRIKAFLDAEKKILDEKNEIEITVRELRKTLSDVNEIDIRAQVSPLKRKVLSEIDHESMVVGIKECNLKIAALDKLAEEVEDELAALKLRATDPCELYSKMQENDARIEDLRMQHKACLLALEAIESASDNLRLEISPRLGEFSANLMQVMTDKKYTEIDVSDGLKLSFVGADGEKRAVDCLSGGTRDLTYISLRMALIDMLYTEKPPVSFDESFAHQDNARARSMMKAIKKLADDGQQSFIFTCREREGVLAEELFEGASVFKLSSDEEIA